MAETKTEEKARKDRAASTPVVMGRINERISVLKQIDNDARRIETTTFNSTAPEYVGGVPTRYTAHIERLEELQDELRRSMLKKGSKEESE